MRYVTAVLLMVAGCGCAGTAQASSTGRDTSMDRYLAIWSRNANITPAVVNHLYARRVIYYGRAMSVDAVYRDKLAFTQRWPARRYVAVPGSVTNDCRKGVARCRIGALFNWTRRDRSGRVESGTSSVRLDLAGENGTLKVTRESGVLIGRR